MAVVDVDARVVKRMIHDITVGRTKAITKTKKRGRTVVTGGASIQRRLGSSERSTRGALLAHEILYPDHLFGQ
ncbi:hypothetical protein CQZ93_04820 [Ochrobactrum vermis]|nr:hypothetical protein CQZ93_04820 [Ochrobactrum vermis]